MACRSVESWTLTSLVGAYLDLTLAHLLLAGATIAFFASKLLSLFGLSLPCSCDRRFGHPRCAQTSLLVDFPTATLAAVHRSLLSRFPFDSLLSSGGTSSSGYRCELRCPSEDGDSCSPSMPAPVQHTDPTIEETLVQIGGAGHLSNPRDSISDHEKPFSDSDDDGAGLGEEVEEDGEEKDSLSGIVGCSEELGRDTTRILEMELEEERGARAALYIELEKERSAAASAADEAMAMILRLQKEKAEIDMESRQYQRMIEEKYAYDVEEMEILKEIIVRREMEKLVLEKEVQMYKQMLDSGGNVDQTFDTDDIFLEGKDDSLVDSSDDPLHMLQQIYKSIGNKEGFGAKSSPVLNSSRLFSNQDKIADVWNNVESLNSRIDCDQEFQEKIMLTAQMKPSFSDNVNSSCREDSVMYNLDAPSEDIQDEYLKDITDLAIRDEDESNALFEIGDPSEGSSKVGNDDTYKECTEFCQLEAEAGILDVHVIDHDEALEIKDYNNQNSITPEEKKSCTNFDEMELNIRRSCSEITNRITLIDNLSGRGSYFNLRSSMPFVETERYKLENEVEGLRKRLEIIRQGREKLSLYADQKEKETFQLQLLDEIALQLKQIKKVTEPIKSLRRVSLPPSSKFKVKL